MRCVGFSLLAMVLLTGACNGRGAADAATISVDSTELHQTMLGWEATDQSGAVMCESFDVYAAELFDRAVNELGINRIRLELISGAENGRDNFSAFRAGGIDFRAWRASWYAIENDDDDPFHSVPSRFHFSALDRTVQAIVSPLRERLQRRGEPLYVNLTYVGFGAAQAPVHRNSAEEYAEFVLAAFEHMQRTYGWVPDGLEVVLEPDVAGWSAQQYAQAFVAAGRRLREHGFTPELIGPSTTDMSRAVKYFDVLADTPGALEFLKELSYHRYRGASAQALRELAQRAEQGGFRTAMLEHIGADYRELHEDLKLGRNSSWSQYALGFCRPGDRGGLYYIIDESGAGGPTISPGVRTPFLAQYFRHVRRGATRVGASSTAPGYDALAFRNASGSFTVVVKAETGGVVAIEGLPAGTYGIGYSTADEPDAQRPDVTIRQGQALSASIPGAGVLAVFGRDQGAGGGVEEDAVDPAVE